MKYFCVFLCFLCFPLSLFAEDSGMFGIFPREILPGDQKRSSFLDNGIVVDYVIPGSTAEKAGLRMDDGISEVSGDQVTNCQEFIRLCSRIKIGEFASMKIIREDSNPIVLEIVKGKSPEDTAFDAALRRLSTSPGKALSELQALAPPISRPSIAWSAFWRKFPARTRKKTFS